MTHDEIDNAIAVMQAYKEGKMIESTAEDGKPEWRMCANPCWDFYHYTYRIKPELPKHKFNKSDKVNIITSDIDEIISDLRFDEEQNTWMYWLNSRSWYSERQLQKCKPHYRPFKSVDEVMKAIKEHGNYVKTTIDGDDDFFPVGFSTNGKRVSFCNILTADWVNNEYAFRKYTFTDGTPFGKLED